MKYFFGLVFFFSIIFSCASPPEPTPYQYPVSSFVLMTSYLHGAHISSGSGSVIGQRDGYSIILTAAHVCAPEELPAELQSFFLVMANGKPAFPIAADHTNDVCIMHVFGGLEDYPVLRISEEPPNTEETYYTVSSPLGIASPETGLIARFSGLYLGFREYGANHYKAVYSISSTGGSSGSPIVNSRNEVVGITTHAYISFPTITVSPTYPEFYQFVKTALTIR